jgi:hypothetical protein
MADHILPFPVPHRGDPDPRRMALASIGFRWQGDTTLVKIFVPYLAC